MPHKGYRQTPEHRARIGTAHRGQKEQPKSAATRAKISASLIGNKRSLGYRHTPEALAKISAASTGNRHAAGHKASSKTRAKMSAAMRGKMAGPRHPNWRGGISRGTYAWSFNAGLREQVRRRDGHKCRLCGAPQEECHQPLSVHHIDYDKRNSDPVNLIALCCSCHSRTGHNRAHWKAVFRAMMIRHATQRLNDPGE